MSDKIKPHHLERKAILHIRQSSAYQVSHNLESQKLQYAMQERLQQLGWREIEVVDEDLGRSTKGPTCPDISVAATGSCLRSCRVARDCGDHRSRLSRWWPQ